MGGDDGALATPDLTDGERALLDDARSDDVSFDWVLQHLNLIPDAPPDWRPGPAQLDAAFASLAKMSRLGLVSVGRIDYVDGGPPGRVSPVRHVPESLSEGRRQVEAALSDPDGLDWRYSCWVVA